MINNMIIKQTLSRPLQVYLILLYFIVLHKLCMLYKLKAILPPPNKQQGYNLLYCNTGCIMVVWNLQYVQGLPVQIYNLWGESENQASN